LSNGYDDLSRSSVSRYNDNYSDTEGFYPVRRESYEESQPVVAQKTLREILQEYKQDDGYENISASREWGETIYPKKVYESIPESVYETLSNSMSIPRTIPQITETPPEPVIEGSYASAPMTSSGSESLRKSGSNSGPAAVNEMTVNQSLGLLRSSSRTRTPLGSSSSPTLSPTPPIPPPPPSLLLSPIAKSLKLEEGMIVCQTAT
jgi:hypothetical protein